MLQGSHADYNSTLFFSDLSWMNWNDFDCSAG